MSRNHEKLRVFQDAHQLTLAIYRRTKEFPREGWFGIRVQMRRAAVSIASNIVEGNARGTTRDYLRFLHMALGSGCELKYLAELTGELGYASGPEWAHVVSRSEAVVKQLQRLVQRMEQLSAEEAANRRRTNREQRMGQETEDQRPETGDQILRITPSD